MSKFKPRRLLAGLGAFVLVMGSYVGWQVYQGQQMANQYASDAQSSAQTAGSKGTAPSASSVPTSPSPTTPATSPPSPTDAPSTPSTQVPGSPGLSGNAAGSSVNSSPPGSPASTSNPQDFKQSMANPYQKSLQAMQNVKSVTLALQSRKLSLTAYRSSILQAQATFTTAEDVVRANPPTNEKLTPAYQELLAGIRLANQSMSVVLNGIATFSPSSLYAAREMGKKAQQQVIDGYAHL